MKKKDITERLRSRFGTLTDFKRHTRLPVSMETCRRYFHEDIPISALSYIIILKYLGLSQSEIKEQLATAVGDGCIIKNPTEIVLTENLAALIGDSTDTPTQQDQAAVACMRALTANPDAHKAYLAFLEAMDAAYHMGLKKHIDAMNIRHECREGGDIDGRL